MKPSNINEVRERKKILQKEISNAMGSFRKDVGLEVIEVNYKLQQEEGGLPRLGEHSISPEEIDIKLEDV
jgi:hypothetical protein